MNMIDWNGGECPVQGHRVVNVRLRDGCLKTDVARSLRWDHTTGYREADLVGYRLVDEDLAVTAEEDKAWQEKEAQAKRTTAADIMRAGLGHMDDRAATYDKPEGERSMSSTVDAFKAVTGVSMTSEQGWLFMALLKAVRTQQGGFRLDNYEDGAAYFALAGEDAAGVRA